MDISTFVFFILHLSHAFHTLLCLTSPILCDEWLSGGVVGWWCPDDFDDLWLLCTADLDEDRDLELPLTW